MKIYGLDSGTNQNIIERKSGPFTIVERKECRSTTPQTAVNMYFFNKMGGRVRQLVANATAGIVLSNGAMQAIVGDDVEATTGVKGVGDLFRKSLRGKASGETTVQPEYRGRGLVITEPTYRFLIPLNINQFNGSVVLEDGYFYACETNLKRRTIARSTLSSAVAGNEGMFNLQLEGDNGVFILESDFAEEDLVVVDLDNETLKIDGSMAIAWSGSLKLTVERSSKTLIGSTMTGDGLLNVYRGTGRVIYKALATN